MTDKPRSPWPMLAYHELPFDLENTAWDVASMCSLCPLPYRWDRNQLEDSNGNSVIVADCIPAINAAPAMLLELAAARAVVKAARDYQTGVYDVSLDKVWDALSAYDAAIEEKK